ncbi:MAG: phosphotransferase [Spirochaetaceae bacterium]|nr:phosphotransferase [Spirochaetaceae bacterium]
MDIDIDAVAERFAGDAIILDVEQVLKSGKEAVVFRCSAHPSTGVEAVAVKVYKDIEKRGFRDMADYLDGRIGRTIRKRRDILHMFSSPDSMQAYWVQAEYEALERLHGAGLPVPKPLAMCDNAVAMEFVGEPAGFGDDGEGGVVLEPAPRLRDARLGSGEAAAAKEALVAAVRRMLELDLIHGDLSPYNVLVREGKPVIIDFPQAIDARFHSRGAEMLSRDLANILGYFGKRGLGSEEEGRALAAEWWELYERNAL